MYLAVHRKLLPSPVKLIFFPLKKNFLFHKNRFWNWLDSWKIWPPVPFSAIFFFFFFLSHFCCSGAKSNARSSQLLQIRGAPLRKGGLESVCGARKGWIALTVLSTVECVRFALQYRASREDLAKFAVEGVSDRKGEWIGECGEGGVCMCVSESLCVWVCVCAYPLCVCPCEFASVYFFHCLTKFRGPDLEKGRGKWEKVEDLNELVWEGVRWWAGWKTRQRSDRDGVRERERRQRGGQGGIFGGKRRPGSLRFVWQNSLLLHSTSGVNWWYL